jgi:glycosyltransferase involved in cell wall biosynthesis
MKKINILHIIAGLGDGGAEAVLFRLCTQETSHNHTVVSMMDDGKYGSLLKKAGVKVYCLGLPKGRITFRALLSLWTILQTNRPHVVQTWMYHSDLIGGVLARLSGVPRVCWGIHNTILELGKSSRSTILVSRINALLSSWLPDVIICCAEKSREIHASLGYANKKIIVISNGYDLLHFRPDQHERTRLRTEWKIHNGTFLIGMVGRFDPFKDHENLLDALGLLRGRGISFICVLVGKDLTSDNRTLTELIARRGLDEHIRLLGERADIPAIMNALDVHVLSSSAEAFPNVLAEAMACGTPCVTTDVGDAALIVGDTGWVTSPKNPGSLADAVESSYKSHRNSDWLARCHNARKRIYDHFGIKKMCKSYNDVWNKVL